MIPHRLDIAVIGAGIGGLAAALALARKGREVVVFERSAELGEVGAGLQLGPNAMKVMQALGVPVEALASEPKSVRFCDGASGRRLLELPLGAAMRRRYGAPFLQIHRADLLGALADACEAAGVAITTGAEVADVGPQGHLTAQGARHTANVIIAADGVRSGAAAGLFTAPPPRYSGRLAWRALVDAREPAPQTRVWLAPGAHIVAYPLRGGRLLNLVAVRDGQPEVPEDWRQEADPAHMRATFGGLTKEARALLDRVSQVRAWGLFRHELRDDWVAGKVALLGDAAHPMLPFFAQGASMAIEDAWVLAETLAAGEPLASYAARRQSRAWRVQKASTANGRTYHAGGALRLARNGAFAALSALPPPARLRRFDWLYGEDVTRPR